MASANEIPPDTPPATPPGSGLSKAQVLQNVLNLATQFSSCVEAFNLIHPHRYLDHAQKIALAKLGIQQGRLLIFGDAVGISSPPASIARHMVPSQPGATNPDPQLPINFGIRDVRLDEETISKKVGNALNEIAGRPSHLTREELMDKYGLKTPKRFSSIGHPSLDSNRLEAFREKYALLQDLVRQSGIRTGPKRSGSITMTHWVVCNVEKFENFVETVKVEVDGLIALMGVKEQVDRGMKTDIKAMGWHPDLSGPVVRTDWEKLRMIREAVADDYPEYVEVADKALTYISEELRDSRINALRASYAPPVPIRRKSEEERAEKAKRKAEKSWKSQDKKRSSFLSGFKFGSWGKPQKSRSKSIASTSSEHEDPQRSLSEDVRKLSLEEENALEPVRSKSLSAIPDEPAPFNLDSRVQDVPKEDGLIKADVGTVLTTIPTNEISSADDEIDPLDTHTLVHADTANSLVDRHDMYQGVGRIDTKDIRDKSHAAAGQYA